MDRRKNLVALGPDAPGEEAPREFDTPETAESEFVAEEEWVEDEPERRAFRFGWVLPTLAVLAILGWTGLFGWVHQREILAGANLEQWTAWVVDWAVPVLLVIAVWLLAMRNSRREAARFGAAA